MSLVADDEERFQLAANAARRLVSQCLAHVKRVSSKMNDRIAAASRTSPYGADEARALKDEHLLAFKQMLEHVEATTNALVTHLAGLKRLLDDDTFLPLPAMVVARAIAEVAASGAWIVHPGLSSDERAARGYAAMFAAVENSISGSRPDDAAAMRKLRVRLRQQLGQPGTNVKIELRVNEHGVVHDDVAQVFVGRGRTRARAKVRFNYSQRVKDEIPRASELYSALSAVAHGEHASITTSWSTPDAYARVIAHVVVESTEAWSRAVHNWVGVTPGPFLNEDDRQNVIRSIPAATRASAVARFTGAVAVGSFRRQTRGLASATDG